MEWWEAIAAGSGLAVVMWLVRSRAYWREAARIDGERLRIAECRLMGLDPWKWRGE